MRLLIIDPADFIGGAELFTIDLINQLPKDYDVILATSGNRDYLNKINQQKAVIEQIEIKRLKVGFTGFLNLKRAINAVRGLIKKHKINLIVTNSIRAHIVGSLASRKTKTPLIWMVHDFTFPGFFARCLSRYPRAIITCSAAVKHDLKNKIHSKHHHKLHVIPNGIDLETIKKIKPQFNLRKDLNLKDESLIIGHVGRIDSWKGQEHLIRAALYITASMPKSHIVFVGDASAYDPKTIEYKNKLLALVDELNLKSHISFLGYQQNVIAFIKQFNLFVHTSIEPEPFGRVIIEAMASGIPVIGSSIGGGPVEIITNAETGLLCNPLDHKTLAKVCIMLLESQNLSCKLVKNGLKVIEKKFTIQKTTSRLIDAVELIARK